MSNSAPRVRFAPSPTGPLHMGGVRTALYNYLFAKKHGGTFILRIEDTDQTRFVEGAEQYIAEALQWCGLQPDESPANGGDHGPYRQSERSELYKQYAAQLINDGKAYYAFDTPDQLDNTRKAAEAAGNAHWKYDVETRTQMSNSLTLSAEQVQAKLDGGEPYVVRIKIPADETVAFTDIVRGDVQFSSNELDDKVLFKSDGLPTYHLANVVDDHLMEITHVIRGEEWLSSAPLHVMLYRALGWESSMPQFAHLPLILKPTGKGKLSKRDGDAGGFPVFPIDWIVDGEVSATGYREAGYYPEAFVNMLAFLGWNPGTEQELFALQELAAAFSLDRVQKAGARFDPDKAKWFNQQYLWQQSDEALGKQLEAHLNNIGVATDGLDLAGAAAMMKERVNFVHEMYENARFFFEAPTEFDAKTVRKKWKDDSPAILNDIATLFEAADDFSAATLKEKFSAYLEAKELGFGAAAVPLRLCLTGAGGGPDLFEIVAFLGKKQAISRINDGIQAISAQKQEV